MTGDVYDEAPTDLFKVICHLIRRDDIKSVCNSFTDVGLWRALADEQERRSAATELSREQAFRLSPTTGAALKKLPKGAWGAHIGGKFPGSDLVIYPPWRRILPEQIGPDDDLWGVTDMWANHYLLVEHDYGEIRCADRSLVAGWVLYKAHKPRMHGH